MTFFGSLFISVLTAFSLFGHHAGPISHKSFMQNGTVNSVKNEKMLIAEGDISEQGETIHLSATFPVRGGPVTGTVSGDCTGQIHGNYSGDQNGKKLSGVAMASCSVLLIHVSGSASFEGVVNSADTAANVNYTANFEKSMKSGVFVFSLSVL